MLRRWLILVLFVLHLQPALGLVPGQLGTLTLEIEHALVHESGQGHHHDEMPASQLDVNGAAPAHVHHDAGHHSALPLTVVALHVPSEEPAARVAFLGGRVPDPHLEGPLRPPRPSV